MRKWHGLVFVFVVGCGGSVEASDNATADALAEDASRDTSVADTILADTATLDSAKSDSAVDSAPIDAGPCRPFWCGCGTCVPADIVCTRSMTGCPLGCPSGPCPAMDKEGLCTEAGDRCVRNGIDAPIACLTTADCPPGQCCSGTFTPPGHGTCGGC